MAKRLGRSTAHVVDASRTRTVFLVGGRGEFTLEETGVFLRSLHVTTRRESSVLSADTLKLWDFTLEVHSEEQIAWETWAAVQ